MVDWRRGAGSAGMGPREASSRRIVVRVHRHEDAYAVMGIGARAGTSSTPKLEDEGGEYA